MILYNVIFQFPGKEACLAHSASFELSDEHNCNDLYDTAMVIAKSHLQDFFKDVFPDEVLPLLRNPEIIEIFKAGAY